MDFTAADVGKLRETTGAGLMECKKALTESKGNMQAAIDLLRVKGKASQKRSGRDRLLNVGVRAFDVRPK